MSFKQYFYRTILFIIWGIILSPLNTFAGTLTNVSVELDSHLPSATTTQTYRYTTESSLGGAWPNTVLFLTYNADFAGNFSFDGIQNSDVTVTVNGSPTSIQFLSHSGFGISIIINQGVPAGANVVVVVHNVVNPNHDGSFGFFRFWTSANIGLDMLDTASPTPVIIATPDTTPPTLSQTTAVTTPTNSHTPSYTFTTNEAGTITYGGSCSSSTTAATVGANTVTFNTLADGTYSNCTITVTDAASNASTPLAVSSFTVDTVAPVLTEISQVPAQTNTADAVYHFSTSEACSIQASAPTASPVVSVSTVIDPPSTPGTNYTARLSGIQLGGTYSVNFQCRDAAGNTSNLLHVGPFTVIGMSGGLGLPVVPVVVPVPTVPVATVPITTVVPPVVSTSIKYIFLTDITPRRKNNSRDVAVLQAFLNDFEWESLRINGIYNTETEAAVRRFQLKYFHEILAPWKITNATGNVGIYTRKKLNALIAEKGI